MYGFISGVTDNDDIRYCPKCGNEVTKIKHLKSGVRVGTVSNGKSFMDLIEKLRVRGDDATIYDLETANMKDSDILTNLCQTVRNPKITQIIICKIKYRPQRGCLEEAMRESREFASIEEMFTTIASESNGLFNAEDLLIGADVINDERIGWKESRAICTKQYGDLRYDVPQCIGFCTITINDSLTGGIDKT